MSEALEGKMQARVQYDPSKHGRNGKAIQLLNAELRGRGVLPASEVRDRICSQLGFNRRQKRRGRRRAA
jgi:hypothetical protein